MHTAVDDPSSQPRSLPIPPLPPSLLISPNPNLTRSSSLPKYRYTKWLSALVKLAPTTSSGSSFVAPTPSLLRDVAVNERCSPRCVRPSQHVENKLGFYSLYLESSVIRTVGFCISAHVIYRRNARSTCGSATCPCDSFIAVDKPATDRISLSPTRFFI